MAIPIGDESQDQSDTTAIDYVDNTDRQNSKVVVIGAGPTGLMLANLLGMYGIPTLVLERRLDPFTEPRAIAFDPETLRLFQTVGCYEALAESLQLDVPVHYMNANGKTLARISDCPPAFGHSGRGTFYQPELEQALQIGLGTRPEISLQRGIEVTELRQDSGQVILSTVSTDGVRKDISASYVVDCSGGASQLRRQLGIEFTGNTFPEKWLVIDVEGDDYVGKEIEFFCDPKRPAVTLPVSKNRRRWEFLVMPGDDEAFLATEESARALMATYGAGNAERIERCLVYTFHARFADRFRERRVMLAGDAAHVMPPFAGQGLNSGMRDAANLSWKLAGVVRGACSPELLDSYEQERRGHVEDMTKLAIKLGGSIMPTSPIRAWIRDRIMLTSWRFKRTRDKMNRGDMIPKPSIQGSKLANWGKSNVIGKMIDQPAVLRSGQSIPLDDLLGSGFAVVALNCRAETALHPQDTGVAQKLNASITSISSLAEEDLDAYDAEGALCEFAGADQIVLLVRPDRFVIDAVAPFPEESQFDWVDRAYLQ